MHEKITIPGTSELHRFRSELGTIGTNQYSRVVGAAEKLINEYSFEKDPQHVDVQKAAEELRANYADLVAKLDRFKAESAEFPVLGEGAEDFQKDALEMVRKAEAATGLSIAA